MQKDNRAKLAMSSKEYPVTAGDTYSISFAIKGEATSFMLPVDSSYRIRIANFAVLNGYGKTFLQLKNEVEEIINKNYPLNGVQFFIVQPAEFQVMIKGEVASAGLRSAWGLSRLSDVFYGARTDYSSSRQVEIVSEDGRTRSCDLFKAKRYGDLQEDPLLRPGDCIIVKESPRTVSIGGAVRRPGRYELLEGDTMEDLVRLYADGLLETADTSRIQIYRTYDAQNSSGKRINLSKIDPSFPLMNFDSIYIEDYKNIAPVMFFEGAVNSQDSQDSQDSRLTASNRVPVHFNQGETYAVLIRRMRGHLQDSSDLEGAYIRRSGGKVIPIDLTPILYDDAYYSDERVEFYDTLVVPFRQLFVNVAGAVASPGRYPYIPDRTWQYYIALAGGFIKSQNAANKITITDKNLKKCDKADFIVPDSVIMAETNSFLYYFGAYAPVITTILTTISTILIMTR